MASIFISHSSKDKIFVEKLAKDLKKIGLNVWFDKWEIKVGDSLTWKIEEGIRENEFLGIVLSPEALESEWVKSEISSAWVKQMNTKKIIVLPILYRKCEIPYFLQDRKYANFTQNYDDGLRELFYVFGIKETETIDIGNWRKFTGQRNIDWKKYREKEFENLVTVLTNRAMEYNWSSWVGRSKNPYSITLYASKNLKESKYISIKLNRKTNAYLASYMKEVNPNNLQSVDYIIYVGNTVNECEEFIWRHMEDFKQKFGNPEDKASHFNEKYLNDEEKMELLNKIINDMRWYKGENYSS